MREKLRRVFARGDARVTTSAGFRLPFQVPSNQLMPSGYIFSLRDVMTHMMLWARFSRVVPEVA